MDAPIASAGMQPAPQRPVELDRVQAPPPAVPSSAAPSFASQAAAQLDSRLSAERSIERDASTGALVYRLIDLSSGIVTFQTPSDARLKLRAYIDGVISRGAEPSVEVRA